MPELHRRSRIQGVIDDVEFVFPTICTSPLVAWYSADTLNLNDNDLVTTWDDRGPLGLTLTGSTLKPTFKTNQINGYPAVRFADKFVELASRRAQNPCTYFMVCNFISNINHAFLLNATGDNFMWLQYGSTWYVGNSAAATVAQDNGVYHNWCATLDSGHVHRYFDGSDQGGQDIVGAFQWSGIGFDQYSRNVDVAEFIVYDRVLNSTQRLSIDTYLRSKYKLP
jgi:hypothetical protein